MKFFSKHGTYSGSWLRSCHGPCEATGWFPSDDPSEWPPRTRPLGFPARDEEIDDGWRFIPCKECSGTGQASLTISILRLPLWLWRGAKIIWRITSRYDKACGLTRWENTKLAVKIAYLIDLGICRI